MKAVKSIFRFVLPIMVGVAVGLFCWKAGVFAAEIQPARAVAEVTWVCDGDTIEVLLDGKAERVRMLNIDTPEFREDGYWEAAFYLHQRLYKKTVWLEYETPGTPSRGKYGRLLAYVYLDGQNVNLEMVRRGYSRFYTKYGEGRYADEFRAAEKKANN